MIGMTATIGIGTSGTLHDAKSFILEMCAKFRLKSPPSEPPDTVSLSSDPDDRMYYVFEIILNHSLRL